MCQGENAGRYLTDKQTGHGYFTIYDPFFMPFQHKPVGVFEVGTQYGGSVALWDDYFDHPDTRIRSIDIIDLPEADRGYTDRVRLDIVNINDLTPEYFKDFPVDIAIDDGSHVLSEQVTFVKLLHPLVREGGLVIVEDVKMSIIKETTEAMKLLGYPFMIVDLNNFNNWWDNVLFVFMK
jgi:cephalosporin hydroxylase